MNIDVDFTKATFQDVVDYVASHIGGDFEKTVLVAQEILENPGRFTGPEAASLAKKLSVYRMEIGMVGEYFKLKTQTTQKASDKLTKGALIVMYDALEEIINCLKLITRTDANNIGR